jgi:hypothetical protein
MKTSMATKRERAGPTVGGDLVCKAISRRKRFVGVTDREAICGIPNVS